MTKTSIVSFEVNALKKETLTATVCGIAMMALILDAQVSLQGAQEGIKLCIAVVIPSLFPLFVVCILLCSHLQQIHWWPVEKFAKICRIPTGGEYFLIPAFLGGYPAGAQALGQAYKEGKISKVSAQRLLSFANNAGPAFLFGMVGPQFEQIWKVWALWGIHILCAMIVARRMPVFATESIQHTHTHPFTIQMAVEKSIRIMASICGWIVVFRVILAFLGQSLLCYLPLECAIVLTGLLELSNGCCMLSQIVDPGIRFIIAAGLISFGGVCVGMQTGAVAQGIPLTSYWKGKCLQTALSVAIAWIVQAVFLPG